VNWKNHRYKPYQVTRNSQTPGARFWKSPNLAASTTLRPQIRVDAAATGNLCPVRAEPIDSAIAAGTLPFVFAAGNVNREK
jgi:hypothetical protein